MNAAGDDLRIRARTYDPISFEKWTELRTQGWARGTWLLSLTFAITRRPVYTFLLYARRHEFAFAHDPETPVEPQRTPPRHRNNHLLEPRLHPERDQFPIGQELGPFTTTSGVQGPRSATTLSDLDWRSSWLP